MVFLKEIIGSAEFQQKKHFLPMVLGKDIHGAPVVTDLAKMPHLLVAGTTGSGKSVGVNCMITSLFYNADTRGSSIHHGRSEDARVKHL